MSGPKTTRCTPCGAEFTDAEIAEAASCPTCGGRGVPMAIAKDRQVTINEHELRILCMWAENHAALCDKNAGNDQATRAVGGIVHRLTKQLPGVPLTLSMEMQQVADVLGSRAEVFSSDGARKAFDPGVKS